MECPLQARPARGQWRPLAGLKSWFAVGLAAICLHSSASAQSPPVSDGMILSNEVQFELQRMQQQIDELKSASVISSEASTATFSSAPVLCCPSEKPTYPTKPKYPTARLTGFFQADAVGFSQDRANMETLGGGIAADGDIQDGADFRRARLAATGQAWDNVSYMLEMDFAFPGRPSFMDVWLDIDDVLGSSNLRVGQFRQPFGMDGLTSVREMTFLERALPFAFLPFRQIGAMLYGNRKDELATWAIAGFRYPTDTFGGNVGDNGGYGMATRLTGLLVNRGDGKGLVHLGGGYSFIDPANDQFQYRNQPEVAVGETGGGVPAGAIANVPAFVDTGAFAADNANLFNAELTLAYGSFYAQSEASYAVVTQPAGPTLTLPGAYAHAGYFLTGETRKYNGKNGVFGRVTPDRSVGNEGGIGAWEIAGRWSYLDLNDENIQGGRLNDLTAGLNWYLNPYTKFQFNYIHAMLDHPTYGESDADIFAMRAQLDF